MRLILGILAIHALYMTELHAATTEEFRLIVTDTIKGITSFNQIEVVDMRAHKDDAGYLRIGPFNHKNTLVCKDGLDNMLTQFLLQSTQSVPDATPQTLFIIVRDFSLADRPVGSEMGTFYARMDFYLGTADQFVPILKVDSFFETINSWDVTGSLRRIPPRKIKEWIQQIDDPATRPDSNKVTLSRSEILAIPEQEKATYPIYHQPHQKGIYYTLEEFLNNTPGATGFLQKNYRIDGRLISYFYEQKEGKKRGPSLDKIDCYAVFDGTRWHKKTSAGMVTMTYMRGDFYFPEKGYGLNGISDDVAIAFGILGAALEKDNQAIYRMRLNPKTGNASITERLQ